MLARRMAKLMNGVTSLEKPDGLPVFRKTIRVWLSSMGLHR